MTDVARGFTGHDLIGASYTHEQVEVLRREDLEAVSYTHLTLPTICSV